MRSEQHAPFLLRPTAALCLVSASELAKNGALSISLDGENLVQAERSVVVLLPLQGCMEQCCLPAGILWLPSQLYRGSG